jgi:hypothetical protein
LTCGSGASRRAPTAEQVDGGTQFKQRVIGGLDPVHARKRVEDHPFLLLFIIGGLRRENDSAERNQLPIGGPVDRSVVPRKISSGDGDGFEGSLAATARRNSRNSWPVLVGKPSVEWPMMSV